MTVRWLREHEALEVMPLTRYGKSPEGTRPRGSPSLPPAVDPSDLNFPPFPRGLHALVCIASYSSV